MTGVRRGSTLIAVLLLVSLLLVGGLALMSSKSLQYDRLAEEVASAQALALAQAGLEDVLVKIGKSGGFPPLNGQTLSYSEEMWQADGTTPVGRYRVTIDSGLRRPNGYLLVLTSVGTVGQEVTARARHTLRAEFDLNPSNATYFKLVNLEDLGGH